jgi:hypothetical protein
VRVVACNRNPRLLFKLAQAGGEGLFAWLGVKLPASERKPPQTGRVVGMKASNDTVFPYTTFFKSLKFYPFF